MRERLIQLLNEATDKNGIYLDKIADYLLANGVIVLPCKMPDELYRIWNYKYTDFGEHIFYSEETEQAIKERKLNDWLKGGAE